MRPSQMQIKKITEKISIVLTGWYVKTCRKELNYKNLNAACCGDSFRSKQSEVKTVIRLDAVAGVV